MELPFIHPTFTWCHVRFPPGSSCGCRVSLEWDPPAGSRWVVGEVVRSSHAFEAVGKLYPSASLSFSSL